MIVEDGEGAEDAEADILNAAPGIAHNLLAQLVLLGNTFTG